MKKGLLFCAAVIMMAGCSIENDMMIPRDVHDLDTADFCNTLNMTREEFDRRMAAIKDRSRNPGYSSYTRQIFLSQISNEDFSVFQEKIYRFPGFYVQRRSVRQYQYPVAAQLLGDVAEVSPADIEEDEYSRVIISANWALSANMRNSCEVRRGCRYSCVMPVAASKEAISMAASTSVPSPAKTSPSPLTMSCRRWVSG